MTTAVKKVNKLNLDTALDEPWCLVCGAIVKTEGVKLVGEGSEDLQAKFHDVLKASVPKRPPSDIICKRCERTIKRIAGEKGEAAEREVEYVRKTYRKTVTDYNLKVEKRTQKLKKVTEAFMSTKLKPGEDKTEKKVTVAANRWRIMAKAGAGSAATKLPVPVASNGASSPSGSVDGLGGAAGDVGDKPEEKGATSSGNKPEVDADNKPGNNHEEAKNPEKNPLVKHDSLEEVRNADDTSSPDSQVAKDKETKNKSSFFPDMPFGLFKKKEAEVEKKVLEEVKVVEKEVEDLAEKVAEPAGDAAKTDVVMSEKEVAKETVKEVTKEVEAEDGGTDKLVNGDVKSAVEEKIEDGKTNTMKTDVPPSDKKIESSTFNNKTEDTPLMSNNESKVKDTGPGMLCCTIM